VVTVLLVIVPTQGFLFLFTPFPTSTNSIKIGSTIGRGLHRIVGTTAGVIVAYLFAWATLDASGPNSAGRWVVMEFLLAIIEFFGIIVQLVRIKTNFSITIGY
jgi:hypothetical protein